MVDDTNQVPSDAEEQHVVAFQDTLSADTGPDLGHALQSTMRRSSGTPLASLWDVAEPDDDPYTPGTTNRIRNPILSVLIMTCSTGRLTVIHRPSGSARARRSQTRLERARSYVGKGLRWLIRRWFILVIMFGSLSVVAIHFAWNPKWTRQKFPSDSNLQHWELCALPGLIMFSILACGIISKIILRVPTWIQMRPRWFVALTQETFRRPLRVILFLVLVDHIVCRYWLFAFYSESFPAWTHIERTIRASYWALIIWFVRVVGVRIAERMFAFKHFNKQIHDMAFLDFVLDHLCYTDEYLKNATFLQRYREFRHREFSEQLKSIRDWSCSLPLQQTDDGRWMFATNNDRVELSTEKEVRQSCSCVVHI